MSRDQLNSTHSPELRSFIESANTPATDFPIQNLPLGIFSRRASSDSPRPGTAIGDYVLDLAGCADAGLFRQLDQATQEACTETTLNRLMSLGASHSSELRRRLSELLSADNPELRDNETLRSRLLVPMSEVEMHLPAEIGDYTDFYASIHHATNVGSMFRPDNPLLPNYKYLPVGYHGRASSVVVSGRAVRRPMGQISASESGPPVYAASRLLDYELEVGFFIGAGNELGEPIRIEEAEDHIFGLCLLNDWSARDIQRWEYQPLGPFLAKSFATSISPWVVTIEALAPFRRPAFARGEGDPAPLPHLFSEIDQERGGIDIELEVWHSSRLMREAGIAPQMLSSGNFRDMYWTIAQMVAHQTSNGCNLRPGDLLASGTVSGATRESRGSLLELAWRGTQPVRLATGEELRFLQDGDEVILRGYCHRSGAARIGFGECRGMILPAGELS